MLGRFIFVSGLAGSLCLGVAPDAQAQMRTSVGTVAVPVVSSQMSGPTRLYSVPRAQVLGLGSNLISASLGIGSIGIGSSPMGIGISGISGNAVNFRADMGMGPNFELGTGIGVVATTPWRGRLDVSGKWGLMQEGNAIASIASMAGGVLEVDANGTPNIGLQVGLPITKMFAFTDMNQLGISVVPSWNLGLLNAPTLIGGTSAGLFNFFGVGLGADLSLLPTVHLLADTNLGFPVTGLSTQTALGLRFDVTRDWTADVFMGFNSGANLGTAGGLPALGLGSSWRF